MNRAIILFVLLAALGLVISVAGCGGSNKSSRSGAPGTGGGGGTGTGGTGTGTGTGGGGNASNGSGGATGDSTQTLGGRSCMVYVPSSVKSPAPLLLTWHGAGGSPSQMMPKWKSVADSNGFIVIAPPHNGSGSDYGHATGVRDDTSGLYNIDLDACYVNGFSAGGQTAFGAGIGQAGWAGIMAFSAGVAHTPPMPNASGMLPVYWVFGDADGTFGGISTIRQQVQWVESEGHNVNFIEVPGGGHSLSISNAGEAWSWITSN
ncbi:MAG: hypothetical protein E3J72_19515 [Planctomycetota bacterium]|nr:MAG: hypothetical protein E3J72_19515 [Planctomycetota bacterium]